MRNVPNKLTRALVRLDRFQTVCGTVSAPHVTAEYD